MGSVGSVGGDRAGCRHGIAFSESFLSRISWPAIGVVKSAAGRRRAGPSVNRREAV
jgi:hypothetical protein